VNSELKGAAAAEADKQNPHKIIGAMQPGRADGLLESLYGSSCSPARQTARYEILLSRFADRFGAGCAEHARLFSAPGRTELGGNHTDHNCGKVLAAAVSIDMLCAACASEDMQVVIDSEGFAPVAVDLHRVGNGPDARFFSTTDALVLGVAEAFQERGTPGQGPGNVETGDAPGRSATLIAIEGNHSVLPGSARLLKTGGSINPRG